MADDVQAGRRGDLGRQGAQQVGVHERLGGAQEAMRDAALDALADHVEHGDGRRLRSRARRRRDGHVRACSGPSGLRPPPIGALTYSITSPPCVAIRLATFAVSIVEPPPMERKPSKPPSRAAAAARAKDSSVGSTRIASKTSCSMPSAASPATIRSVIPSARTAGSATTIARVTPSRASSQPASAEAPGPNFSGVASTVKTVSWSAMALPYPLWATGARVKVRSRSAAAQQRRSERGQQQRERPQPGRSLEPRVAAGRRADRAPRRVRPAGSGVASRRART